MGTILSDTPGHSRFRRLLIPILSVVLIPFITILFDRYGQVSQDRKDELDLQARLLMR